MKQRNPSGSRRLAVGIDFGGTTVKMGLVDDTGRIRRSLSFPTSRAATQQAWLEAVAEGWRALVRPGERVAGVGVGVPGFVDFERGFIHELTNVSGWIGVPLAERLRRRFGVPARVDNDVNAMAWGECVCGAGRGRRHAVLVTLGTGVGGGLLLDGRIYRGAHSIAGEVGHVTILMNGRRTPQGQGGLEAYVGNRRIAAMARSLMRVRPSAFLAQRLREPGAELTPKLLAEAAARGDTLGLRVFDRVADCLAAAFASITYLVQPEVFIVGGGVAQSGRVLFDPLRRHLAERLSPYFAKRVRVIPARFGNRAGMIGCAMLVLRPEPGQTLPGLR